VSALYDVLFVSADRLVVPDAEVAWVEMDEVVSFLNGGEADWRGESRRWAAVVGGVKDSSPLVVGGASIRLGAGCMLEAWLSTAHHRGKMLASNVPPPVCLVTMLCPTKIKIRAKEEGQFAVDRLRKGSN
jgi:hypothetical protein